MPIANTASALELLKTRFAGKMGVPKEFRGETTVEVDKSEIVAVAQLLKDNGFNYLVDLSGVDNFGEEPRFEVVYEFASVDNAQHLRVKVRVSEDDEGVPTISHLYQTANWHEREAYDMVGMRFIGHPDLRRILMWEGYPYHPLRKDFPLEGKETLVPGEAFTKPAPLAGGPFVTAPASLTIDREPRARPPELP